MPALGRFLTGPLTRSRLTVVQRQVAEALREAEAGELVMITRYGRPVAALVPADLALQAQRLHAASPDQGLGSLIGRYPDAQELLDAVDELQRERDLNPDLPEFE